jgi:hypothetical protein
LLRRGFDRPDCLQDSGLAIGIESAVASSNGVYAKFRISRSDSGFDADTIDQLRDRLRRE